MWCWRRLLRVPWTARRSNQSPKGDQSWVFIGRTDVEAETPILWPPDVKSWLIWKRPWCWEGLGAGGEGDNRGWDGWMASPTQWTWVWVVSGSWWWTGRPGVLQFMGLQRVGYDWATELNWSVEMLGKCVQENEQDSKRHGQDHLRDHLPRTVLLTPALLDSPLSGVGFLAVIHWEDNLWLWTFALFSK